MCFVQVSAPRSEKQAPDFEQLLLGFQSCFKNLQTSMAFSTHINFKPIQIQNNYFPIPVFRNSLICHAKEEQLNHHPGGLGSSLQLSWKAQPGDAINKV